MTLSAEVEAFLDAPNICVLAQPGVVPPELIGRDARLVDRILSELRDRGVCFERSEQ